MKTYIQRDQGMCSSTSYNFKWMGFFLFFSAIWNFMYVYVYMQEIACVNKTKPLTAT